MLLIVQRGRRVMSQNVRQLLVGRFLHVEFLTPSWLNTALHVHPAYVAKYSTIHTPGYVIRRSRTTAASNLGEEANRVLWEAINTNTTMTRIRGRRVLLLLATALPLMARDDAPEEEVVHEIVESPWWTEHQGRYYNVVIPYQPPPAHYKVVRRRKRRRRINETVAEEVPPEPVGDTGGVAVDYASKSVGALILDKSSNWKGTSSLLNSDRDQYAIVPCEETAKWVVVGLSEDILVKQVVLANYERYSSHVREFMVMGSQTMGNDWVELGKFEATPKNGKQSFDLPEPAWARYLKFRFLTHYGDEHYCTVSQISVHGSTMLQGFHEHWSREKEETENEQKIAEEARPAVSETDLVPDGATALPPPTQAEEGAGTQEQNTDVDPEPSCTTALNAVCPADLTPATDLFRMSGEYHDFEFVGILSSASMCRSSREASASSFGSMTQLDLSGIAEPSHNNGDPKGIIATSGGNTTGTPDDTPVKKHMQHTAKRILQSSEESNRVEKKKQVESDEADVAVESSSQVAKASPSGPSGPPTVEAEALDDGLRSTGAALAKILQRLPSASCLEKIDFASFKEKKLNSKAGPSSTGSSGHPSNAMEPIFKKLTDEIKTLQSNLAIHDQFTKESVACYQRVLLDLLVETESSRLEQDARIQSLEDRMYRGGLWIGAIVQGAVFVVGWLVLLPARVVFSVDHIELASLWGFFCATISLILWLILAFYTLPKFLSRSSHVLPRIRLVSTASSEKKLVVEASDDNIEPVGVTMDSASSSKAAAKHHEEIGPSPIARISPSPSLSIIENDDGDEKGLSGNASRPG